MARRGNSRYAKCVAEALEVRTLMAADFGQGVWQISSELNVAGDTDTIEIRYAAGDSATLEAYINGTLADSRPVSKLKAIRITGSDRNDVITADFAGGEAIRCIVLGKGGDDTITTGDANDRVVAGKGNDTVNLGDGRDVAVGGQGDDTLTGEGGRDVLNGNGDNDTLEGGDDNDVINGGGGDDSLAGGLGKDKMDGGWGKNQLRGSRSFDRIIRRKGDLINNGNEKNDLTVATDEELKQLLIDAAVEQYKSLFGTTFTRYHWWYNGEIPIVTIGRPVVVGGEITLFASMDTAASPASVLSANSFSGTNNQVSGVEEADYIKTNGDYIYHLKSKGADSELTIIRTVDPDNPEIVSQTTIEGHARALFLNGDRVTVITSTWGNYDDNGAWYWYGTGRTNVTMFDVSAPDSIDVLETTRIDGEYRDARETGGELYLVLDRTGPNLPGPRSTLIEKKDKDETPKGQLELYDGGVRNGMVMCMPPYGGPSETYQYETEAEYRAYLASIIDERMPTYTVTDAAGVETTYSLLQDDLFVPEEIHGTALTTIVNFGLLDDAAGVDDTASTFGFTAEVYATQDAMYLTSMDWSSDDNGVSSPATDVYKFDLGAGMVDFSATGVVPGYLLNQFSMDEHAGHFRMATTTWGISNWRDTSNGVYVLEQEGDDLAIVGAVDNMAPGERIQSARFVGDRAFVVTFRQVDPLFALDMSDPTRPEVKGELKVPGFSSYLQMIDDTHLLGIGTGNNAAGWLSGLQLSLFDVSDLSNPKVVEQFTVDLGGWSSSDAKWDSHAVSWFAESGVLVIPVYGAIGHGFIEYRIDPDAGFEELGLIEHDDWGANRSLRINDRLYTFSRDAVKVTELSDPSNLIAELSLSAG